MWPLNIGDAGPGENDTMRIRVKFGRNIYQNEFTCSHCGRKFSGGGLFLRIEYSGSIVDIPLCSACVEETALFEGCIALDRHRVAHPIGRA